MLPCARETVKVSHSLQWKGHQGLSMDYVLLKHVEEALLTSLRSYSPDRTVLLHSNDSSLHHYHVFFYHMSNMSKIMNKNTKSFNP